MADDELTKIYDGYREIYNETKDKNTVRTRIIKAQLALPPYRKVICSCGKEFVTDREFVEFYIDTVVLRIEPQQMHFFADTALGKWRNHKEELKRAIDEEHKWCR